MIPTDRLFARLGRFNLPGACLIALLQRTPALRVATAVEEAVVGSPIGSVLRSAITAAASLGAIHSLAGATTLSTSTASPLAATVGTPITTVVFAVRGSPAPAASWRITGAFPAGLTISGLTANGLVNTAQLVMSGTPTTAGTYAMNLIAYEGANGTKSFQTFFYTVNVSAAAATAPVFTIVPTSQTVPVGTGVSFAASATGTPAPTFQWRKDGVAIGSATNASFTLSSVQFTDAGAYSVVASNSAGSVTSAAATLTVNPAPTLPVIAAAPVAQSIATGSTVVFSVVATSDVALNHQWLRDGAAISGATSSTLVLSGPNASAGSYACRVSNAGGSVTSGAAALTVSSTPDVGRLVNLAIRTNAGTGAQTLIVGFVIGGGAASDTKPLLLRGVGPTLGVFGVPGVLTDPVATLFQTGQIAVNDNWQGDPIVRARAAQVGAFALADTSLDAALALSPLPGSYTVQITGNNNGTGIALAEIYDATPAGTFTPATARLINASARTQVGTGGDILIAGFVVGGSTAKTVLVRAVGPGLAAFGVPATLADPKLQLFSGQTVIRENDDWGGDAQLIAVSAAVGAFGLPAASSKDAVLLVTLPPGAYTAQVSGADGGTGVAIVELYDVP